MMYNPQFPYYMPPTSDMLQYQKGQYQMQQPAPTINSGIQWVQGENAAKSFYVAPGCTVALWDSENQVIFVKSADASGMPSMRVLEYTERNAANAPTMHAEHVCKCGGKYPTIEAFNALKSDFEALRAKMEEDKDA